MIRRRSVKGSDDQVKISFALPDDHPHAAHAYVAGTFNDWDPKADPLIHRTNETHSAVLTLEKGKRYAYRYVTEDGEWFNVGDADEYEDENGILLT
jgi:1,4-alpha-glucan branching enzyme